MKGMLSESQHIDPNRLARETVVLHAPTVQRAREHRSFTTRVLRVWVSLFAAMSSAEAGILVGPVTNPGNGHSYYLLSEDSWLASESQAMALGGHLATIRNEAEQSWVFGTFGSWGGKERSLWIGLNDAAEEGRFTWSSGEGVPYTHWLPGQPDNSPVTGGEGYVHMLNSGNAYGHPGGFWNDLASLNTGFPTFDPVCGVVEVCPPVLSVHREPFQVCWLTSVGVRYQVQWTSDLVGAVWTDAGLPVPGTGGSACASDMAPGVEVRFFRVIQLP